jgi:DNA-binding transcriptional ArsR family regulator
MSDLLSDTFSALADPTRRAIIARLAKGAASVSEVAEPFLDEMSLPAITKHLKVLERAGLVSKSVDAQRRVCELNPDGLKVSLEFLDQYRQLWEESLDRLDVYLKSVMAQRSVANRKTDTSVCAVEKTKASQVAKKKIATQKTSAKKSRKKRSDGRKS